MYAFISDTHLSEHTEEKVKLFINIIGFLAKKQGTIYLLGDLFDFWAGDDDFRYPRKDVSQALRDATDSGSEIFLITGNRDFLISKDFSKITGIQTLPEIHIATIDSEDFLLTHGDLLCTKDVSYQIFRKIVQNRLVKWLFLLLPLRIRMRLIDQTKQQTKKSVSRKAVETMDVEQTTVVNFMSQHNANIVIHGHTHLAGTHHFHHNGRKMTRIVLGDWDGCGSIFIINNGEKKLVTAHDLITQYQ